MIVLPRVIRLKDASRYLGMDKNRFNKVVRPHLPELRIGIQGVGFDRLDLDQWFEQTKGASGCPVTHEDSVLWVRKKSPVSKNDLESGKSTNASSGSVFAKALAQLHSKKQKNT